MKKRERLFPDSEFEDMISVPGICCKERLIFSMACIRLSRRRRWTSAGFLANPLLMQRTTTRLSYLRSSFQ